MKSLLSAALALAVSASPALAIDQEHVELITTLEDRGASVYVNAPPCYMRRTSGLYTQLKGVGPAIVICQDNKQRTFDQVEWTPNDLDTLRHEAIHYVQDCIDGNTNGATLQPIHSVIEEVTIQDIIREMGPDKSGSIIMNYMRIGTSEAQIINELEAFYMAENLSASEVGEFVAAACPLK